MASKCVHKGCGKRFSDPAEECVYHPGPPIFHEGQKGWKCCKPRVLTFDEFLSIPPCTTGIHSTVDDSPAPPPPPASKDPDPVAPASVSISGTPDAEPAPRVPVAQPHQAPQATPAKPPPPPESDSDDPSLPVPPKTTCRRRGCNTSSPAESECVHHPGQPLFHEGSKGWTCCKRRVLEFDEFMRIEGCKRKPRHLFVGSGKKGGKEETLSTVKHDFYQTPTTVIASLFLKKIIKDQAKVDFDLSSITLNLRTADHKRYENVMPLFGQIDAAKSTYKIMGTKLELTLVKADRSSWPVLRSDERVTEIIQVGQASRAL